MLRSVSTTNQDGRLILAGITSCNTALIEQRLEDGNSEIVSNKHCLQVTDDHFAKAVQYFAKNLRQTSQAKNGHPEAPVLPSVSSDCENLRVILIGRAGLEPATKGL